MFSNLNIKKTLVAVIALGFVAQLLYILFAGERHLTHEYKTLVSNLLQFGEYSYHSFQGKNLPSAYMPPLYSYFLLFWIKIFNGWETSSISEISDFTFIKFELLQAFIGLLNCFFIYKICQRIDKREMAALLAVALYLFFPLTIITPSQISAINIYMPLTLALLFFVDKIYKNYKDSYLIPCSIILALLILVRAEAILYIPLILLLINLVKKVNIKGTIIFIICTMLVVFPWGYRNYTTFGQLTPLTLSGGFNLWRGHHENATSDGYGIQNVGRGDKGLKIKELNPELAQTLIDLPKTNKYEVLRDNVFREDAIKNIRNKPLRSIVLTGDKFIALWIHEFNSKFNYNFINHPAYYLPWLTYVFFFILGLYKNIKKFKVQIVIVSYLIVNTIIPMIFFVLPRYRLHLLPVICIYASFGLIFLVKSVRNLSTKS